MVQVRDVVVYVDEHGVEHQALVTHTFERNPGEYGVNLVYVHPDREMEDSYGRQILRATSIVHQSSQPAHGVYWRELDAP